MEDRIKKNYVGDIHISKTSLNRLLISLADGYQNPLLIFDEAGCLVVLNKPAETLTGYQNQESYRRFGDIFSFTEGSLPKGNDLTGFGNGSSFEASINKQDGSVLRCSFTGRKIDLDSAWFLLIEIKCDVAYLDTELNLLFNLIPDLICIASANGYFLKLNSAWENCLGYSPGELIGKPVSEFIHPDDVVSTFEEIGRQLNGESTIKFLNRYVSKSGDYKWLEWHAIPSPDGKLLYAAARDVTEWNNFRKKLEDSEMHYRHIADNGSTLIWMSGTDKKCIYFNKCWLEFTGRELHEELGDGWAEGVHPDDLAGCFTSYSSAFEARIPFSLEYRLRFNDGTYRWIQDDGTPRFDNDGNFIGYIGHCFDIHEKKIQQQIIEKKEEDYRTLYIDNPQAMFTYNKENLRIIEANQAALEIYGYSREEFLTLTVRDIRPPEDVNILFRALNENVSIIGTIEDIRHKRKNGEIFWVSITYHDLEYKGVKSRHVGISDVTKRKTAELSLIDSERRNRLLFETLIYGIIIQDGTGNIISSNRAAEKMMGLTPEQLFGKRPGTLLCRFMREDGTVFSGIEEPAMEALRNGAEIRDVLMGIISPDNNNVTWVNVCATPLFREQEPSPYQVFTTLEDITVKKNAAEEVSRLLNRLNLATNSANIGIWEWDIKKDKIIWDNKMFQLYGHEYDLSTNAYDIWLNAIHPDDRAFSDLESRMALKGEKDYNTEYRVIWPDGSIHWLKAFGEVFTDEEHNPVSMIGVNFDFTDMVNARENLKYLNESLELKVADRTAQLETANRAKSEFLANMSHELRTPMNAVLGYSELLDKSNLSGSQKNYVSAIRSSGRSLLTLINDILDLSKIEAGKLDLEYDYIDPFHFFPEFEKVFLFKLNEKEVEYRLELPSDFPKNILLDESRLRQVISNLIGNAVKFTNKGRISLLVNFLNSRLKEDDEGTAKQVFDLIVKVEDTGLGIERGMQEKIFEPFIQEKAYRTFGGTGLGLPISRKLTELMRGTLTLESEPGKGSVFTITIPEVVCLNDIDADQTVTYSDLPEVRFNESVLLIVDDVQSNRSILSDALHDTQLIIYEAENGAIGYDMARELVPDLIISDIRMPVLDGFGFLEKLKSDELTRKIPVIAYSASVLKGQKEKIFTKEFAGLLIKPVSISGLFSELMKFLPYRTINAFRSQSLIESGKPKNSIKDLQDLIGTIDNEFIPRWERFSVRQPLGDVRSFGHDLSELGEKHGSELISRYGNELEDAARSFEVGTVLKLLKSFRKLKEELEGA